jgi:o-succinylbenzoate synthase
MKLSATYEKRVFHFKIPSGTSRGVLTEKLAWFIHLSSHDSPFVQGVGECSVIPGLSPDFQNEEVYAQKVSEVCQNIDHFISHPDELSTYPSIYFGLEMALLDLQNGGKRQFFETPFNQGKHAIPINGLIWMGSPEFMHEQIEEKLQQGFDCIKMKIGAIDFDQEIELLKGIRKRYTKDEITLRVDANGAFSSKEAMFKLEQLAEFDLHSIEQPIAVNQHKEMAYLCAHSPLPIALDEELIGHHSYHDKERLLEKIKPPFIILKPSLIGGFKGSSQWIELAEKQNIKWWITSALESNIGLSAIAQFTSTFNNPLPQGLGTGSLYTNNIESSLFIKEGKLFNRII